MYCVRPNPAAGNEDHADGIPGYGPSQILYTSSLAEHGILKKKSLIF